MPRKPKMTQHKLRMPENLRHQIEAAAAKLGKSANREMVDRLWSSFETSHADTIETVAQNLEIAWGRWGNTWHETNKQSDLLKAAEALAAEVEQLPETPEHESVKAAAIGVRRIARVIDIEAARLLRRMHMG
jgi:Arc-like DNA binding domain